MTEPSRLIQAETENGANGAEVALKTVGAVASGTIKVAGGAIKVAGEAAKVAVGAAAFVGHVAPEVAKGVSYGVNDVVVPAAQFTAQVIVPTAQRGMEEGSRQLVPVLDEAMRQTAPVIEPAVEVSTKMPPSPFHHLLSLSLSLSLSLTHTHTLLFHRSVPSTSQPLNPPNRQPAVLWSQLFQRR
jgi:hypothetical protein